MVAADVGGIDVPSGAGPPPALADACHARIQGGAENARLPRVTDKPQIEERLLRLKGGSGVWDRR